MKIMVFDVPADSGGALTIVNDFYADAVGHEDKKVNWIFVLSTPNLKETKNVKVLRFPWIKKGWGHRLFFDMIIAPNLVKKYKVDRVFSLQNIRIPRVNCKQILYVHQSLPFADYKFTFKDNRLFWIYQNIIGKGIFKSIRKVDQVIVQTKWMKDACVKLVKVEADKITVIPPKINIEPVTFFEYANEEFPTFFYPANAMEYKNHSIIVEACRELKKSPIENYEVLFTVHGDENKFIADLQMQVKDEQLPIRFIGTLKREEVFDLYCKSILLFPSYIESFGLPMLEARSHKGMIIASDCPFSTEILAGYENAYFFNPFKTQELVTIMRELLGKKISYKKVEVSATKTESNSILNLVIE